MKILLKYLKLGGIFLGVIIITSLIMGLLNLIGLSSKITSVLNIIAMILLFLIFGIIEGINTTKKGFLAGFKIGLYFLALLFIINIIMFQSSFGISRIVYYLILLFCSVFGAMIGINRKKKE